MDAPLKKKIALATAAVVLVGAAAAGWFLLRGNGAEAALASGNGRIEATEIDIATKLAGRIVDVKVKEGDFVKAKGTCVGNVDQSEPNFISIQVHAKSIN